MLCESNSIRAIERMTNAFSKKRKNLDAAVSPHYAYYNLVKTHGTIRCTPAMAARVAKSHWSVARLVETVEGTQLIVHVNII